MHATLQATLSAGLSVGRSIGLSVAECSEHATYGDRPCFCFFFISITLPIKMRPTPVQNQRPGTSADVPDVLSPTSMLIAKSSKESVIHYSREYSSHGKLSNESSIKFFLAFIRVLLKREVISISIAGLASIVLRSRT